MNYRWTFRQKPDDETINKLARYLKIPVTLATVLAARGLSAIEDADKFFKPSLEDLHDPFLMDDMDKATDRILKAVKDGENIWIHGDYDVDGTSSAAIAVQFLRSIGAKADYYIPDRFTEGYGLSATSINQAKKRNATLLITVDVGITSFEPIKYAILKGMDVIICDHHEPGEQVPDVFAILDPIKKGCSYPFKNLAACGVVFKLLQGLSVKIGQPEKAFEYLDFVAVASAADMVPLVGENRILVHYGLEQLNTKPRPGFKGLMYCTGLKEGSFTASNIVFGLAPLINAAGRMGDALRSVEMMISNNENHAFRIAQQLEDENRKRRVFDQQTFEETLPLADEQVKLGRKSLVIHKPHWHAGVIGIVASRLVDRYNLPTVLMTTIDKTAKGSARSISAFDIHSALKACSGLLTEFGGHKHAAGLSIQEENIPVFSDCFDEMAQVEITTQMLIPEIIIDTELKLNELSPKFIKSLSRFAPYGFDNNKPVFFSSGVTTSNGIKIVGANNLKFRANQSHFVIDAIGYNLAHKQSIAASGKPFSIVYTLEMNNFNGSKNPQLFIKDIRSQEDTLRDN